MRAWLRAAILALLLIVAAAPAAWGETRVALVIANAGYRHVPRLTNPANDGPGVAAALRQAGFTTITVQADLDYEGLRRALQGFAAAARNADLAVIYYAGHGMEVGGTNYLVPIDAKLATDGDVQFEAVPLALAMQAVRGAHRLGLVMLDACRNNPFAAGMQMTGGSTRAVARGLTRVEPLGNTLVVYAARDGTTADDGAGRNSPFAKALIQRLPTPGLEVSLLFRQVRDDVLLATNNVQQPFVYGSLGGEPLFFVPARPTEAARPARPSVAPATGLGGGLASEVQRAVESAHGAAEQAADRAKAARDAQAQAKQAAVRAQDAVQRAVRKEPGYGILTGGGTDPAGKEVIWTYSGQVAGDRPEGYGAKNWPNGEIDEGQFIGGTMSGYVTVRLPDGTLKEGQLASDQTLLAVVTYGDGDTFQGAFTNGTWSLGVYYGGPTRFYTEKAGQWSDYLLAGFGVIRWKDGRRAEGVFRKGDLSGLGVTYDVLGNVVAQGVFEAGALKTAMSR